MSTVIVNRVKSALMVPAKVIIDGENKGNVKNGASINFDIPAGTYQLQIQSTFGVKSAPTEITVGDSGTTTIEIAKSPRYMKYYFTTVYPIMIVGFLLAGGLSLVDSMIGSIAMLIVLCISFVFVRKANMLIFDITQK